LTNQTIKYNVAALPRDRPRIDGVGTGALPLQICMI